MDRFVRGAALLAVLAGGGMCGCVEKHPPGRSPTPASAVAESASIDDAYYTGTGDPKLRTEIVINGSYFKSSGNPDVADCETRLPNHPEPSQRVWKQCRKIKSRSGTMYHVVAEHGAAYDLVAVRVRGANGGWSNAHEVRNK